MTTEATRKILHGQQLSEIQYQLTKLDKQPHYALSLSDAQYLHEYVLNVFSLLSTPELSNSETSQLAKKLTNNYQGVICTLASLSIEKINLLSPFFISDKVSKMQKEALLFKKEMAELSKLPISKEDCQELQRIQKDLDQALTETVWSKPPKAFITSKAEVVNSPTLPNEIIDLCISFCPVNHWFEQRLLSKPLKELSEVRILRYYQPIFNGKLQSIQELFEANVANKNLVDNQKLLHSVYLSSPDIEVTHKALSKCGTNKLLILETNELDTIAGYKIPVLSVWDLSGKLRIVRKERTRLIATNDGLLIVETPNGYSLWDMQNNQKEYTLSDHYTGLFVKGDFSLHRFPNTKIAIVKLSASEHHQQQPKVLLIDQKQQKIEILPIAMDGDVHVQVNEPYILIHSKTPSNTELTIWNLCGSQQKLKDVCLYKDNESMVATSDGFLIIGSKDTSFRFYNLSENDAKRRLFFTFDPSKQFSLPPSHAFLSTSGILICIYKSIDSTKYAAVTLSKDRNITIQTRSGTLPSLIRSFYLDPLYPGLIFAKGDNETFCINEFTLKQPTSARKSLLSAPLQNQQDIWHIQEVKVSFDDYWDTTLRRETLTDKEKSTLASQFSSISFERAKQLLAGISETTRNTILKIFEPKNLYRPKFSTQPKQVLSIECFVNTCNEYLLLHPQIDKKEKDTINDAINSLLYGRFDQNMAIFSRFSPIDSIKVFSIFHKLCNIQKKISLDTAIGIFQYSIKDFATNSMRGRAIYLSNSDNFFTVTLLLRLSSALKRENEQEVTGLINLLSPQQRFHFDNGLAFFKGLQTFNNKNKLSPKLFPKNYYSVANSVIDRLMLHGETFVSLDEITQLQQLADCLKDSDTSQFDEIIKKLHPNILSLIAHAVGYREGQLLDNREELGLTKIKDHDPKVRVALIGILEILEDFSENRFLYQFFKI